MKQFADENLDVTMKTKQKEVRPFSSSTGHDENKHRLRKNGHNTAARKIMIMKNAPKTP